MFKLDKSINTAKDKRADQAQRKGVGQHNSLRKLNTKKLYKQNQV